MPTLRRRRRSSTIRWLMPLLYAPSLFEAAQDCYSVGVLEVRPEGEAAGHGGNGGDLGAEALLKVEKCYVTLREGLVAMITSRTGLPSAVAASIRSKSSFMRSWPGPIPDMGERAPLSTW